MRVDVWSDVVCPWCFVGLANLDAALERFEHADEVDVVLHSFQLDPARRSATSSRSSSAWPRSTGPVRGSDQGPAGPAS